MKLPIFGHLRKLARQLPLASLAQRSLQLSQLRFN
jgi:hypothetical protein